MTPEQLNSSTPMADREELLRLASLCEAASGPDREMDMQLWRIADGANASFCLDNGTKPLPWLHCYSASLDAAMLLVPEGWMQFDVDATAPELGVDWTLHHGKHEAKGTAATPALALAAASLRARAQDPLRAHGGGE